MLTGMLSAAALRRFRPWEAATDPLGEVDSIQPLHPEIQRTPYFPPPKRNQNKPPAKQRDKPPRKPLDPEHQVDDYA